MNRKELKKFGQYHRGYADAIDCLLRETAYKRKKLEDAIDDVNYNLCCSIGFWAKSGKNEGKYIYICTSYDRGFQKALDDVLKATKGKFDPQPTPKRKNVKHNEEGDIEKDR